MYIPANSGTKIYTRHVVIGDETKLSLSSSNVWIENGKILKATPAGRHLKVMTLNEGQSLVSIGDEKYQFYVFIFIESDYTGPPARIFSFWFA